VLAQPGEPAGNGCSLIRSGFGLKHA
jgi:hypothetical protein